MAQYLAPGVYVEEVPAQARPIAGVGTSTAGFIGVVADDVVMPFKPGRPLDPNSIVAADRYTVAPAKTPVFLTGWEQFKNQFGDFTQANNAGTVVANNNNILANAVYGFFNNGGTACWVIRVSSNADADWVNPAPLLTKFAALEDIAIVAFPAATSTVQQDALIGHCENLQSCTCILDGLENSGVGANTVAAIQGGTRNSDYAAMYFPWIQVFDAPTLLADPASNGLAYRAPSGHIAGVYARVDSTRGVHKAPANETILGAVNVEFRLTKADQKVLNPPGINVIRSFDGDINIFGARTLGGDANPNKYISTRRFLNFLRESIERGTQFVVFEPNNPALWKRIIRSVSDFLLGQWRDGALFGETAKQAFFVKCDEDTNPPDVREAGQVVTEIGVAIVKPAEFVIFRIQQITGS
jgi:hypothetical protein